MGAIHSVIPIISKGQGGQMYPVVFILLNFLIGFLGRDAIYMELFISNLEHIYFLLFTNYS